MVTQPQGDSIKHHLKSADRERIRALAAQAVKAGPWSVTASRPKGLSLNPHEYFSEGPYWFPDPKNPNGPYIRRDGDRNPDRFTANRTALGDMSGATLALGLAAYLLEDREKIPHARDILTRWFLDPQTRMNPDLEHGQAIRNRNDGRGAGIIDTVSLIHCVQGILLLEAAGLDAKTAAGLRQWFAEYLTWLTTSTKGQAEMRSGNNHMTWWSAQAAAYSVFTRNTQQQKKIWDYYRTALLTELRPNGSAPREEARTDSLSYSTFNADAFATLCRIAQTSGVDLWAPLQPLFNYLMPFVQHPDTWKFPQKAAFKPDSLVFPALAPHSAALKTLPRAHSPWVVWIDLITSS